MNKDQKIILFQDKKIRRLWHDEEWYFSVIDIVAVLTDSSNPHDFRILFEMLLQERRSVCILR